MRQGYLTALHEETGSTDSARIFEIENKEDIDRESLKAIFSGHDRPTAVFSINDFQARMVFSVLKELGLRVPEDVALVGYWNTPWAETMEIPLTSVSIREDKIAQHAAKCVISEHKTTTYSRIMVEPELIIRSSCGAKEQTRKERALTGTEDQMR
jgi:DNA-binding LacI/PurR family transcriptional regulator